MKRFFIIIAAAAALAAAAIIAGITGKNLRISENLRKGKECYQNQQYEMAVSYFNDVLDDDNKSVEAYYFKTNALIAENNYESAAAVAEFGYKMTKSDVLDELRNEITIKPDSAPEPANQPVVSNVIPDDIPQSIYSFTFQTADETIFNNQNIDIMPDVKIPDYIPPIETTVPDSVSNDIPDKPDNVSADIPDSPDSISTDIPDSSDSISTDIPDSSDSISTDTSVSTSAMLNIDGTVTPEEYQIYESLIDKIIDKIVDRIIEYITASE